MNELLQYIRALVWPLTAAQAEVMKAGALLGCLASLALGGMDKSIYALIALVILDYATGLAAGFKTACLSSALGFKGVAKKLAMFAVVAFAQLLDTAMQVDVLRDMAIMAYSANEGLSILENLDRCGWGRFIPDFLKDKVQEIRTRKTGRSV